MTRIDIGQYEVPEEDVLEGYPYTHILSDRSSNIYYNIPSDSNVKDLVTELVSTAEEDDQEAYEILDEKPTFPYAITSSADEGCQILSYIMRNLYNRDDPVAYTQYRSLKAASPHEEDLRYLIFTPDVRVGPEAQKEISNMFYNLCVQNSVECTNEQVQYLPLIACRDATLWKNGDLDRNPQDLPSPMCRTDNAIAKVKLTKDRLKRIKQSSTVITGSKGSVREDQRKARELVPLLNHDRSRDESMFLNIGRSLHRIFNGEDEGLRLWRSISIEEMVPICAEKYPNLDTTATKYGVATLRYYASIDSPDDYREWKESSVSLYLEASVGSQGGPQDIARVLYNMCPTDFVCDAEDTKSVQIYWFNGTYYKPVEIFKMQEYIDNVLLPRYKNYMKELEKRLNMNNDNAHSEIIGAMMNQCNSIIKNLKSESYRRNRICTVLKRLYAVPDFDTIRDANPYLTACEDCVIDMWNFTVREGYPEDYITCSTGYPFWPEWNEYHWEHKDVREILNFLESIIPDEEERTYFRRVNASCLHNSNPTKQGFFLIGPTNNGKTVFEALHKKALGPTLCPDVMPNTIYSGKTPPGAPKPELERVKDARAFYCDEVGEKDELNESMFKRMTGGVDSMTYRPLYGKKIRSFTCKSKPWTVCNKMPQINGNSRALATRIGVITLRVKFITRRCPEYSMLKNMDPYERDKYMVRNHMKWADEHIADKLSRIYKAYMWVMIQDYIHHVSKEGEIIPQNMPRSFMMETANFLVNSNVYMRFKRDTLKEDREAPGLSVRHLYNIFRNWYATKVSSNNRCDIDLNTFINEMEVVNVKAFDNMYYGIRAI